MRLSRRRFLQATMSAAAIAPRSAWAQSYPVQTIRILVGFGPGGASDIVARLVGQALSERLAQPVIVENRPGASTNIATEAVARAPADGYTLLLINNSNALNPALFDKLNFDFLRDIAPVAGIAQSPVVMEVGPSFPAKTVAEFIALAKANPGKITMATSGAGSPPHVWGELFKSMAGVDLLAVPYRGGSGPALADLMGGQVDVTLDPLVSSIELIRGGKLRPLAVTTATRSQLLPDVPTISETVQGYRAEGWWGLGVPRNTSAQIVARLNKEVNDALDDPSMKARLGDLTMTPLSGSPAEFGKFLVEDTEKWTNVIRTAGIKIE